MQRHYGTQYGKDPPWDNSIRCWLKLFQETGSVVAAIEAVTLQMLENNLRVIEYCLDILKKTKSELRGSSPQANSTDRATAACRRS
jgi:hypothetical protein